MSDLQREILVVTIDGPAGSGKSTVSRMLAEKLGLIMLTTGSFYRGLALFCLKRGIKTSEHEKVVKLISDPGFKVLADTKGTEVFLDSEKVTEQLHNEDTATIASQVSAIPEVRKALLAPQRAFMKPPGLIAEGRDCGTVVFPNAQIKIYLTASLDARALRRSEETGDRLAKRDSADSNRKVAPLAKASDAIEIDTSDLTIDEVVELVLKTVRSKVK